MSVKINNEICTGCGRCVKACHASAIKINESSRKAEIDEDDCIECGACIDACRRGAISLPAKTGNYIMENRDELLTRSGQGRAGKGDWQPGKGRGQQGRSGVGRGFGCSRKGAGDAVMGECYCPACGITIPHKAGIPWSQLYCPQCGSQMVRK